jgi:acyl dehydratase
MRIGDMHITPEFPISRDDIINFAEYWDPQPFHISEEAAKSTPFGGLFGSGLQSFCTMIKLGVDSGFLARNAIAGVAIDNMRYHSPLRPNVNVHSEFKVKEARNTSKDPTRIIARIVAELKDENGNLIISAELVNLYRQQEEPAHEHVWQLRQ